jgi:nucleoside-diphosphate-sugar epimerase
MKKNVLVIGGTGFIGSHLAESLANDGHSVVIATTDPSKQGRRGALAIPVEHVVFEQRFLEIFLKDRPFDEIHFLGGNSSPHESQLKPRLDFQSTNVALLEILETLKHARFGGTFWFASSVAVYGLQRANPLDESLECLPISAYGLSKKIGEEQIRFYSRTTELKLGAYRIFSTYGPRLKRQLVYDLLKKIASNDSTEVRLLGDGSEGRDMSFVEDQVRAIRVVSGLRAPRGDVVNVGSGRLHTVREVAETLLRLSGSKKALIFTGERRGFDGHSWQADIGRLTGLGFSPRYSLEEGLERTLRAFSDADQ